MTPLGAILLTVAAVGPSVILFLFGYHVIVRLERIEKTLADMRGGFQPFPPADEPPGESGAIYGSGQA